MVSPEPNNPVELTAHSIGFLGVPGIVACGPPLTGSVSLQTSQENYEAPQVVPS